MPQPQKNEIDFSKLSNEELEAIVTGSRKESEKIDFSQLSNEELVNLVGGDGVRQSKEAKADKPGLVDRVAGKIAKAGFEGIQSVGQKIDSYTGAPVRAAIGNLQQNGSVGDAARALTDLILFKKAPEVSGLKALEGAADAYGKQFGEDPTKTVTGKEIAVAAGVDNKTIIPTPFRSLEKPGEPAQITAADATGLGIDILADPTLVAPLGKGVTQAGKTLGRTAGKATAKVFKKLIGPEKFATATNKLAKTFLGVNEATVAEYLARPLERVQKARPIEEIGNDIVSSIARVKDEVIEGSAKSYEILENSGIELSSKEVGRVIKAAQKQLDNIAVGGAKEGVGEAPKRTASALRQMIKDLKDASGKTDAQVKGTGILDATGKEFTTTIPGKDGSLSAVDAKRIIQQLDESTNYGMRTGEFDKSTNAGYKKVRKSIDKIIKDKVPEYGQVMEGVSRKTQALSDVTGAGGFNDLNNVITRLKNVSKGDKTTRLQSLKDLRQFGDVAGKDFVTEAEDRLISESFNLPSYQGSRKVQLGQGIGATVGTFLAGETGGIIGIGIGGTAGAFADTGGRGAFRKGLDFFRKPPPTATDDVAKKMRFGLPDRSKTETAAKGAQVTSTSKTEQQREAIRRRLERK